MKAYTSLSWRMCLVPEVAFQLETSWNPQPDPIRSHAILGKHTGWCIGYDNITSTLTDQIMNIYCLGECHSFLSKPEGKLIIRGRSLPCLYNGIYGSISITMGREIFCCMIVQKLGMALVLWEERVAWYRLSITPRSVCTCICMIGVGESWWTTAFLMQETLEVADESMENGC